MADALGDVLGISCPSPCRCLTPLAAEAYRRRHEFGPARWAEIDARLHPVPRGESTSTHVSPLGYFSLHYVTSGPDSVPDIDVDPPNGVPDFVERCAQYADFSWVTEVDSMGFLPPELPPDGTYDITFVALPPGYYGLAVVSGNTTEFFLHRNFVSGFGWPGPTDDPEGDQLGRAKVTIAHEFKHASQFSHSGWTEGKWNEADAMWVEELVFDYVNDWHYWVAPPSYSQLVAPWIRMDNEEGQANYEDCLWYHWISGQWGVDSLLDLWIRRGLFPTEPVLASFQSVLQDHGSSWPAAYAGHLEWCWFTGSRAEPPFGFPDAPDLYRMRLFESPASSYPHVASANVDRLAGHPRRFNPGAATGRPRVLFDGDDSAGGLVLSVIVARTDGAFRIERPPLGAGNTADHLVPEPWPSLRYVGVVVTNGDAWGTAADYSLQVLDDVTSGLDRAATGVPVASLEAHPNPSRGPTRFAVSLAGEGAGAVRIVDVAGRTVRTLPLQRADRDAEARWDGRDDAGRAVPSGVYWAIVEEGTSRLARKVTILR